ncbi:MAG TPA: GDYXXLXY domain-containing protein [Chitinophagaceae bacterium]
MNTKKLILTAFVLVVMVQWYVPARMILDQEMALRYGKEYKFRTAPVDPNDPFRGKYITLAYRDTRFPVPAGEHWRRGEDIYVTLTTDKEGFATISGVSKKKPASGMDFVKAQVGFVAMDSIQAILVEYPFNRFYMEESKAPRAERIYNESRNDTTRKTFALVSIRGSKAVLKDVLIDGVSIKELSEGQGK